jgi:hypothetical protein
MREKKIAIGDSELRFTTNQSGLKPLLEILTPDGLTLFYSNPHRIIMKWFDASGAEVPPDTKFYLFKSVPGKDFNTPVRKLLYSNYFGMSVRDQRSTEFEQNTVHSLGSVTGIENPEGHKYILMYEGAVEIDSSKPGTTFEVVPTAYN